MRILFVADGRSPNALNWIDHWVKRGDDVHLVSTFACAPIPGIASLRFLPVAFSGLKKAGTGVASRGSSRGRWVNLRTTARQWLGPLTLGKAARDLSGILEEVRPDLVHALRIPYEGMLAVMANPEAPLLASVWGNDFTLHARSTPWMKALTRRTLRRLDGLLADCQRDIRLARELDYPETRPVLVVPGNGGIRAEIFHPAPVPPEKPVVINPRGIRAYIRNDTFFRSIPWVLEKSPGTSFRCTGMKGEGRAMEWVEKLGISKAVELLPAVPHAQMGDVFREAQVAVSPSTHDGTPNTLLEAMACGCFPVAGDLESVREWITPGVNGLLVDPSDPRDLAQAILAGLNSPGLRETAGKENTRIIAARAEYGRGMEMAQVFYGKFLPQG